MKQLIKNSCKFLFPLLLLFGVSEMASSWWYGKYLGLPGQYQVFKSKRKQVETLFIGDSHINCCTDTSQIPNSYVLWWGARDLYSINKLVEQNIPEMPRLKNIVMNLSYFSFANINSIQDPQTINDYFHLGICPDTDYDHRYLSTLYAQHQILYKTLRQVLQRKTGIPYNEEVAVGMKPIAQLNSPEEFRAHAEAKLTEHGKPIAYATKHPDCVAKNNTYLQHVIELCDKNKLNLKIIIPPLSSFYLDKFTYKTTFYQQLNQFKVEHPGVLIYDYSSAFPDSISYFRDSDHLNSIGAKKFTHTIRQLL